MRKRVTKSQITHDWPHRRKRAALGNGRVQLAVKRAFVCGEVISTSDASMFAYCRKYLLRGRRLEPHDYRRVRQALALIAVPIGRGSGRGRPTQWVLR